MNSIPEWVIFHIPHNSTLIPKEVRNQFILDDQRLNLELLKMTDHLTLDLFTRCIPSSQIIEAPVSRLVVDVERFVDDCLEPMVARGMGVVYQSTSDGGRLRRTLTISERQALIEKWYHPHHERLTKLSQSLLTKYNQVLIIDAHSFPSVPLPYESDQRLLRPEICIGTDTFHSSKSLETSFLNTFRNAGFTTSLNAPFAGALVPMSFYQIDSRVSSIMIEVNRSIYLDERIADSAERYEHIATKIRECLSTAISQSNSM